MRGLLLLFVALLGIASCSRSDGKRDLGTWEARVEGTHIVAVITQGGSAKSHAPDLLKISVNGRSYYFEGTFSDGAFIGGDGVPLGRSGSRPYRLVSLTKTGDLLGETLVEAGLKSGIVLKRTPPVSK